MCLWPFLWLLHFTNSTVSCIRHSFKPILAIPLIYVSIVLILRFVCTIVHVCIHMSVVHVCTYDTFPIKFSLAAPNFTLPIENGWNLFIQFNASFVVFRLVFFFIFLFISMFFFFFSLHFDAFFLFFFISMFHVWLLHFSQALTTPLNQHTHSSYQHE